MLISTPQELQEYLPSHNMESLSTMMGFLNNSEHDFLMERIGQPLHDHLTKVYAELVSNDNVRKLTAEADAQLTPEELLITLCQRVIVFDAFARSADIRAISVNASGFNSASTDDYDAASQESIKAFKSQCVKETHAAVNRLLVQLEEWAKQEPAGPEASEEEQKKAFLVDLWKKSCYFYQAEGLLINTATALSEFLDIYESREKFIQMIPDLRYVQEIILSAEVGDALMEDLTKKNLEGKGNEVEKKSIRLLKRAAALHLEDRSKFFKREAAHSEALQATKAAISYMTLHVDQFDQELIKTSPFAPKETGMTENEDSWKNNRKGNVLFATRPLF